DRGLELDRHAAPGRRIESLEHARLSQRVLAAQQRLGLAPDRVAQVLELQAVRIRWSDADFLSASRGSNLDSRRDPPVPWIIEEERTRAADDLELVNLRGVEARGQLGQDAAGKEHRSREANVHTGRVSDRFAEDTGRRADEMTGGVDAVAADVHQCAAVE